MAKQEVSLVDALDELNGYAEDVANASYQNIKDSIKRFYYQLRPENPIGMVLSELLPIVDFDAWYARVKSTQGGMVGSAELSWPLARPERVAMQLELIRRMANGEIDIIRFVHTFTYVENDFNSNISQFVAQVFSPFHRDIVQLLKPHIHAELKKSKKEHLSYKNIPFHFVDRNRISELKLIQTDNYDLSKLIQLCNEIDFCFRNECFLAVAALIRAILDHIPPIFGFKKFSQVANNYRGPKSFKESMQHLENSARKIGDAHLHTQIREKEILPTATQVNFANDLDVLLAEIVRILK